MNWEPYILWTLLLAVFPGIVIGWMWFWTEPVNNWVNRYTGADQSTALRYETETAFEITKPVRATRTRRAAVRPKARGTKRA
jgi:hypothetical protein